jgi:hypothetical protein
VCVCVIVTYPGQPASKFPGQGKKTLHTAKYYVPHYYHM